MSSSLLLGKKVALIIASTGYQPLEYQVPKDILTANGITVITASDKKGGAVASDGSTTTVVDVTIDTLKASDYDGIFFIGGPGALTCLDNSHSYHIISQAMKLGIPYGAICISPRILAKAHALVGKKATGWDEDNALQTIFEGHGVLYERKDIVTDGLVVTAKNPAAAELFADGIMRVLTKVALKT
jgi:protease I